MSLFENIVDFVLVWETPRKSPLSISSHENIDIAPKSPTKSKKDEDEQIEILEKRRIFEKNLEDEGLKLVRESLEGSHLNFTKICSSVEVLRRYTEILKLRMPMKDDLQDENNLTCKLQFTEEAQINGNQRSGIISSSLGKIKRWVNKKFDYDHTKFPCLNQKLTAIYSRDKEYLFDMTDPNQFFTQRIRSLVIDFIIRRNKYSEDASEHYGIERLIHDKVYSAAYPLHDGDLSTEGSQRHLLYKNWAELRNCFKSQPLDYIKDYFGVNIGIYFAWLGFYTRMLIPAAVLGIFSFIYGLTTLKNDEYSKEVCSKNDSFIMCPLCSKTCQYWRLNTTCAYSKFTYIFDNNSTILFSVLMSFWAAIFLEFWKRYSAQITYKWDLTSFDITEEQPRLEYLSRLKKLKKNKKEQIEAGEEPEVPFWKTRVPFHIMSISTILLLITMAVGVIVAIISYRVIMTSYLHKYPDLQSRSMIIISSSAAFINLILIFIFNNIYTMIASYLTEIELHRTQSEYDDSLTLKIFMLQFVNFYSSIFYIAFFKGRFSGTPNRKYNFFTEERCGTSGCMTELCLQLAIVMVGKQAIGAVVEMSGPFLKKWVKHLRIRGASRRRQTRKPAFYTQWAKDYRLLEWNSRSLFGEYLEMVLQYGFVTIFVAAFPLAPFFALANNILEMRLDATKMLIYNRRPVGQRVKGIGVWYGILNMISRVAVISNALIIAFTSNFIPKLLFSFLENNEKSSFLKYSLVSFNVSHFDDRTRPDDRNLTIFREVDQTGICWFQGYLNDHTEQSSEIYKRSKFFWELLAARLIFVIVFQNFVSVSVLILKIIIPDIPKTLQKKINYEKHLANEIIIKKEMERAKLFSCANGNAGKSKESENNSIEC